jgi:hypothetical protein
MKSMVRITRTGEARQESQSRTVGIGHMGQNNLDRTAGIGQSDRSALTGQPIQDSGQVGQDIIANLNGFSIQGK